MSARVRVVSASGEDHQFGHGCVIFGGRAVSLDPQEVFHRRAGRSEGAEPRLVGSQKLQPPRVIRTLCHGFAQLIHQRCKIRLWCDRGGAGGGSGLFHLGLRGAVGAHLVRHGQAGGERQVRIARGAEA